MIQLTKTLKACASGLVLAAMLGAASPAFAQENYPPNVGPDGLASPTTPIGGDGTYGDPDPGLPLPPLPKGWKDVHGQPSGAKPGGSAPAQQAQGGGSGAAAEAPPLPPGAPQRPQLERTGMIKPPAFFCSEREKSDWLLNVFYPAASAATKNNIKAHNHLVNLRQLRDASTGADQAAYDAEFNAWEPIWRKGEALATDFVRMVEAMQAIPVIDCGGIVAIPDNRNMVAALGAAVVDKPAIQVGVGAYADLGQRTERPFDGSEAESALRRRLNRAFEAHAHDEHRDPPRQDVMTSTLPVAGRPFEETVPGDGVTDAGPQAGHAEPPPPPVQPVTQAESAPNGPSVVGYPPCPTDGMPATPGHIRDFHS
jgi:hypothetical protein